jgi:hypothetical protein
VHQALLWLLQKIALGILARMIKSFLDVLGLWTPKQLSRVLKIPYSTGAAMYQRGSIGPAHWARIIEAAEARGEVITANMLVSFAAARKERPRRRRSSARDDQRSAPVPAAAP